jgi:hypothetical protein
LLALLRWLTRRHRARSISISTISLQQSSYASEARSEGDVLGAGAKYNGREVRLGLRNDACAPPQL